jgi:hypothetical protein
MKISSSQTLPVLFAFFPRAVGLRHRISRGKRAASVKPAGILDLSLLDELKPQVK